MPFLSTLCTGPVQTSLIAMSEPSHTLAMLSEDCLAQITSYLVGPSVVQLILTGDRLLAHKLRHGGVTTLDFSSYVTPCYYERAKLLTSTYKRQKPISFGPAVSSLQALRILSVSAPTLTSIALQLDLEKLTCLHTLHIAVDTISPQTPIYMFLPPNLVDFTLSWDTKIELNQIPSLKMAFAPLPKTLQSFKAAGLIPLSDLQSALPSSLKCLQHVLADSIAPTSGNSLPLISAGIEKLGIQLDELEQSWDTIQSPNSSIVSGAKKETTLHSEESASKSNAAATENTFIRNLQSLTLSIFSLSSLDLLPTTLTELDLNIWSPLIQPITWLPSRLQTLRFNLTSSSRANSLNQPSSLMFDWIYTCEALTSLTDLSIRSERRFINANEKEYFDLQRLLARALPLKRLSISLSSNRRNGAESAQHDLPHGLNWPKTLESLTLLAGATSLLNSDDVNAYCVNAKNTNSLLPACMQSLAISGKEWKLPFLPAITSQLTTLTFSELHEYYLEHIERLPNLTSLEVTVLSHGLMSGSVPPMAPSLRYLKFYNAHYSVFNPIMWPSDLIDIQMDSSYFKVAGIAAILKCAPNVRSISGHTIEFTFGKSDIATFASLHASHPNTKFNFKNWQIPISALPDYSGPVNPHLTLVYLCKMPEFEGNDLLALYPWEISHRTIAANPEGFSFSGKGGSGLGP